MSKSHQHEAQNVHSASVCSKVKIAILGPDETIGDVYFNKLFPMGVKAVLEAADLVFAGKHREIVQDESKASYEGWCRESEARIPWAHHADFVYNIVRGC